MAEIILNVDIREGTGTGNARAVRRSGAVPGILYGGDLSPVAISVNEKDFRKSLYTGKLLGHLVTLKHGEETQSVIAKTVDFDPISDRPMHFDLMRVGKKEEIKIEVAVQFRNADEAPFTRAGGVLEVVRHTVEISVRADRIPSELVVDLTGREIGDNIRISDIDLPKDAVPTIGDRDFMIATIKTPAPVEVDDVVVEGEAEVEAE